MSERGFNILKMIFFSASLSAIIGGVITYFSKQSFLSAMFLVWGALWFNSALLTYEDAMPGGFDNCDGQIPSELKGRGKIKFWLLIIIGCVVLFGLGWYFHVEGL